MFMMQVSPHSTSINVYYTAVVILLWAFIGSILYVHFKNGIQLRRSSGCVLIRRTVVLSLCSQHIEVSTDRNEPQCAANAVGMLNPVHS